MSMWTALLVTGATAEKRKTTALEALTRLGIAPGRENSPDLLVVETDEESLGIDRIRDLKRYLAIRPIASPQKAVLLTSAEKLTVAAQNALLKTLEEPPENAVIALLCSSADLLLPTVVSRCHLIPLPEEVAFPLSPPEERQLRSLLEAMPKYSVGQRLKLAANLAKDRLSAIAWLNKVLIILHQQLHADRPDWPNLTSWSNSILKARRLLEANTNTRLTIENLLLNW